MAQAARQNLRMQKELKLLLIDPPPGVSLSNDTASSSFSLSNIDAEIKGPEGTVYANGVFKIKIQIPDRYPFQPPNVTFATPIYHPNIDTGGRICLDILNLPPKGAWQPSLNISTVLMSIGLLLSEPNPDDGLMCEASKEYKYNKQTFDQKARSMTEKYAKAGICRTGSTPANPSPLLIEPEGENLDPKKPNRVSRKLSLEPSPPSEEQPPLQASSTKLGSPKKLSGIARKLSLKSSAPLQKIDKNEKENMKSGMSRKLSLGMSTKFKGEDDENKENVAPNYQLTSGSSLVNLSSFTRLGSGDLNAHSPLEDRKHGVINDMKLLSPTYDQEGASSAVCDEVIVLDSEDSDEDVKGPVRSRLSIARKPIAGKRKATVVVSGTQQKQLQFRILQRTTDSTDKLTSFMFFIDLSSLDEEYPDLIAIQLFSLL